MPRCEGGMEGIVPYLDFWGIAWNEGRTVRIEIPRSGGAPLYGTGAAKVISPLSAAVPSRTTLFSVREYRTG